MEANSMDAGQFILECLKLLISWPVAAIIILIILKKEVGTVLEMLPQRLKSAEIGGQKIEFFDDLEEQSKVAQVMENVEKENPELLKKSLQNAGINEIDYIEYRSKVKERVTKVQQFLKKLGYDLGKFGADGSTGPDTKKAIKKFQKDHNLSPDGVIGPKTLNKINELSQKGSN